MHLQGVTLTRPAFSFNCNKSCVASSAECPLRYLFLS